METGTYHTCAGRRRSATKGAPKDKNKNHIKGAGVRAVEVVYAKKISGLHVRKRVQVNYKKKRVGAVKKAKTAAQHAWRGRKSLNSKQ